MKLWATLFLAAGLCAPGAALAQGVGAGVQVGPAGVGTNGVGAGAHVGAVGGHAGVRVRHVRRCRGGWYWRHHHRICRRW